MLREARERGLVEITIRAPAVAALDLERQLEVALGLREAVVVSGGDDDSGAQASGALADAASDYLVRMLHPGDVLGVSGGATVARIAQVLPHGRVCGSSIVQLGAALAYRGGRPTHSSAEVALHVAQKLGSAERLVLIPIPSLLDTETIRDALLRDTGVQRAMAHLATCTVALVGIGALDPQAGRTDDGAGHGPRPELPVTSDEFAELRRAGAVGEICARFFDIDGRPCVTSLDRRMVALDLPRLRDVPLVIGVARGRQKARAILGAVRGGYVKTLVTDEVTALEVLTLARPSTGRPPASPRHVPDPPAPAPHIGPAAAQPTRGCPWARIASAGAMPPT
ncbi:MAG: hypothetical protein IT306_17530 [Chloroflexi bacterium]|nr:hypothetical protein [Chloroflexota bacterium]